MPDMPQSAHAEKGIVRDEEGVKGCEQTITGEIVVEAKIFSFRKVSGRFIIREHHKKWEREINLSKDQFRWIGQVLGNKSKEFGKFQIGTEKRFIDGAVGTVLEGNNSWGAFLCFQFGRSSSKQSFLVFPSGYEGLEWNRVSIWIRSCFSLESLPISVEDSVAECSSSRSYADVVRTSPISSPSPSSSPSFISLVRDLERKIDALNSRLINEVLEKLSSCCFPAREVPMTDWKVTKIDWDPCWNQMKEGREVCSGIDLSWKELCGSDVLEGETMVGSSPEKGVSSSARSKVDDVESLTFSNSFLGLAINENELLLSESINETEVGENDSNFELVSDEGVSFSTAFEKIISCNLGLHGGPSTEAIGLGVESENECLSGTVLSSGVASVEDVCTPLLMRNQISREAAFVLLSRGTSFDGSINVTQKEDFQCKKVQEHVCSSELATLEVEDDKENLKERKRWERCATKIKDKLRQEEEKYSKEKLSEEISTGNRILIDGEFFDGLAILKMLVPPPRAKRSRISFYHWSSLVGRPLLEKLRDAGVDVDLDLYGIDHLELVRKT